MTQPCTGSKWERPTSCSAERKSSCRHQPQLSNRLVESLKLHPDGYGFLRNSSGPFDARPGDAFVPLDVIQRFDLRAGIILAGNVQPGQQQVNHRQRQRGRRKPRRAQGPRLSSVTAIEGTEPDQYKGNPLFENLTPVDPDRWLRLETASDRMTTRVIDMFTPIGKGQRRADRRVPTHGQNDPHSAHCRCDQHQPS